MNICVYAIAKNEEQFAERWAKSMSEADVVTCLDTGSTDDTARILARHGVRVTQSAIDPWRFDEARNRSMRSIPPDADVCVCTDLDEYFAPGWRAALEAAWSEGATRARYRYVWSHDADGGEGVVFLLDKIHANDGAHFWRHPVHETLCSAKPERFVTVSGMRLVHTPAHKPTRANYLPLLELAVSEAPEDDRNMHYLGREYMFHGRYADAIATLRRHLALPSSTWKAERAASMRYIALCHEKLGDADATELWLYRAACAAPECREGWFELQKLFYGAERFEECVSAGERVTAITQRELTYMTDPAAWGSLPHDMLSIAYWRTGCRALALAAAKAALSLSPSDRRIAENIKYMEESHG